MRKSIVALLLLSVVLVLVSCLNKPVIIKPETTTNEIELNTHDTETICTTTSSSATGQRYINHAKYGSKILLFVREYKTDRISGGAGIYTFLGTANYVNHTGDRPMSILWKLDKPIPAKFLKKTNKLMIG